MYGHNYGGPADYFYDPYVNQRPPSSTSFDIGDTVSFPEARHTSSDIPSTSSSRRPSTSSHSGVLITFPAPPQDHSLVVNPYLTYQDDYQNHQDYSVDDQAIYDGTYHDPSIPLAYYNPYLNAEESYTTLGGDESFALEQDRPTPSPGPLPQFFTHDTDLMHTTGAHQLPNLAHTASLPFPPILPGGYNQLRRASTGSVTMRSSRSQGFEQHPLSNSHLSSFMTISALTGSETDPQSQDKENGPGGMVGAATSVDLADSVSSYPDPPISITMDQIQNPTPQKKRKATGGVSKRRLVKKPQTNVESFVAFPDVPIDQVNPQAPKTSKESTGKKTRSQVKVACTNCRAVCKKCSHSRPCDRCIMYGIADTCRDVPRKKRVIQLQKPPRGASKKSRESTGSPSLAGVDTENDGPSSASIQQVLEMNNMMQLLPALPVTGLTMLPATDENGNVVAQHAWADMKAIGDIGEDDESGINPYLTHVLPTSE